MKHPVLAGKTVLLRPLKPSDAGPIAQLTKTKAVTRFLCFCPGESEKTALQFIRRAQRQSRAGTACHYAIARPETKELIGVCSLREIDGEDARAEIGLWIGRPYWGCGRGSETVRLLTEYGFTGLELHRIAARIEPENTGSITIFRRNGYKKEGHIKEFRFDGKRWRDHLLFARLNH